MFVWVEEQAIVDSHDLLIGEHGGVSGIRDLSLLQSALSRPRHLADYGHPDLADCAATYAYGIVRNHPFADGNKRTAFVTMELFLMLNGKELVAPDGDSIEQIVALAGSAIDEATYADWIRSNIRDIA